MSRHRRAMVVPAAVPVLLTWSPLVRFGSFCQSDRPTDTLTRAWKGVTFTRVLAARVSDSNVLPNEEFT